MADPIVVAIRSDLETPVGTLAAGTRCVATPAGDHWILELGLPRGGVGSRPFTVPARAVHQGTKMLNTIDRINAAHADYDFARKVLGYSHHTAIAWLLRGYKVDERTLYRWGFTAHALGEAS